MLDGQRSLNERSLMKLQLIEGGWLASYFGTGIFVKVNWEGKNKWVDIED